MSKGEVKEKVRNYKISSEGVSANVDIFKDPKEYVPTYRVTYPKIEKATHAVLDSIRERIVAELAFKTEEILNPEEVSEMKEKFVKSASLMLKKELPHLSEKDNKILIGILAQEALGLGPIEFMLKDQGLEEIVINSSIEPIWVYHREFGWLRTNVMVPDETKIYNYAAQIGRKVGTQITNLNPLMDAYLTTGDRANATLFPISSEGNTLTIRKFARRAWTITDFIEMNTLSADVAAFLWLAIQYEMNIVCTGGTASGKTSFLNVLTMFIPPTQRIISIEDTREIQLPEFLHWVPMTTRPPNIEGKGEVTMLELMINALRMRPDRMIVGEIRRSKEAEVLFEAINTGHSVYSTLHANTSEETFKRLVNPPINIPVSLLTSLQLIAVMHRDRRKGIRRLLEVTELIPSGGLEEMKIELNTIFKWVPSKDQVIEWGKPHRLLKDIKLYSAMSDDEIRENLEGKKKILLWLVKNKIRDIDKVGRMISDYYKDPENALKMVEK
ncbi:MAG: CpaF family protein [Candidatus Aenigmarchaeota archaeon]|nr:CpaF family protein [Candidatus Aenigmarchaeota archaeon]NIP39902.1 CpaF family protein [Candidatus Aenigmarchaeota archaeon]NIQ17621.1 CpaF family protein [Candidatus Aenigmarchaeota archaeon]NIS72809.1 CpaF family protein [Candidatus Aenigmarchaeota archaeon]